jgi:two-component system chemotaxis response regulator CheB
MIRTLIVDDSPTARALLIHILKGDGEFDVVGEAGDGAEAIRLARELRPDLITMDIQMPVIDGLQATRTIMAHTPCPIVVISNLDVEEVKVSLNALRAGALMVLQKPAGPSSPTYPKARAQILATAKAMASVRTYTRSAIEPAADGERAAPPDARVRFTPRVIGLAASTGGPKALQQILGDLPGDLAVPVLIVQHIASGFVGGLATWLQESTRLKVRVASHGERLEPGTALLAPDDRHLSMSADGAAILLDEAPSGAFRPSANVLFDGIARACGGAAVGVILTGIGNDGVQGLLALRKAGGFCVAQDQASSVLFGMPEAAIQAGAADVVLGLAQIPGFLVQSARRDGKDRRP